MSFMLFISLLFSCSFVYAEPLSLDVHAEAAILMNADTGQILYAKNLDKQLYPASITKVATALYALRQAQDQLDVMIAADQECIGTVSEEAKRRSKFTLPSYLLTPDGCHIGIKRGELLSFRDLLYGMMLASGDDASNVIAKHVGGTIPEFMNQMNAYIKQLGCKNTLFCNPHGLHDPRQVTTAYDMALITREALKDPIFREIVATVRYKRPKTNKQESTLLIQTNRMLRKGLYYYPKAIGVKTGYYSLANSTFVAAAQDGDRTLIAVLLKVPSRKDIFLDAKKMFEAAFSQPKLRRTFFRAGEGRFSLTLPEASSVIKGEVHEDVALEYYPAEELPVRCLICWDKNLKLPISKGQRVGDVAIVTKEGKAIKKTPLYARRDVEGSALSSIKGLVYREGSPSLLLKGAVVVAICLFLGFFAFQLRQRKR